ncbi:MAG: hypothetical protein WA756_06960, partial [Pseudolabrys sp.]
EILSYFSISAYIPAARELFGALQGPGKLAAICTFSYGSLRAPPPLAMQICDPRPRLAELT